MPYRMPLVILPMGRDAEGKPKWTNTKGNTECVELVRQTTTAPHTTKWRAGRHVLTAPPGTIPPFTAIATFDANGRYPTDTSGRHAALYLSHDQRGIRVIDQWNKQGEARERTIRPKDGAGSRSNDATTFHVIEAE